MESWTRWLDATLDFPVSPDSPPGVRARARLDMALTLASIPMVGSWGLVYLVLGQAGAAVFPFAYALGTGVLLELLWLNRDYRRFQQGLLALGLAVPFGLQWHLGGFLGSGLVLLWGGVALVRAAIFGGSRTADLGALALVVLVGISMLREGPLAPAAYPLTRDEILLHFLVNMLGGVGLVYVATRYLAVTMRTQEDRADRLVRAVVPRALLEDGGDPARAGPATLARILPRPGPDLEDAARRIEALERQAAQAGLVALADSEGSLLVVGWDQDERRDLGGLEPGAAVLDLAASAAADGARVVLERGELRGSLAGAEAPRYLLEGAALTTSRELLLRARGGRIRAGLEALEWLGPRVEAEVADDGGGGAWLRRRSPRGLRPERPRPRRVRRMPRTLSERVWSRRR